MSPRAVPLPPDERRAEIVRAARPLLLSHGGNFTTRQVAEAAGIAEGTVFRVFPTKRDLMHAVIAEAMDASPVCADLDRIDRSLPLARRLTATVARLQRSIDDVSAIFTALFQMPTDDVKQLRNASHTTDPDARERHQREADMLQHSLEQVLAPDAEHLACSVEEAASLVRSLAFATAHPHLSDRRLTDPERLVQLLLGGLAPGTATAPAIEHRTEPTC